MARNIKSAKYFAKVSVSIGFIFALLSVTIVITLSNYIVKAFSSEEDVNNLILKTMIILSVFVFFDSLQCIGVGIIRGLDRHLIASVLTAFSYWSIGVPISVLSAF